MRIEFTTNMINYIEVMPGWISTIGTLEFGSELFYQRYHKLSHKDYYCRYAQRQRQYGVNPHSKTYHTLNRNSACESYRIPLDHVEETEYGATRHNPSQSEVMDLQLQADQYLS